ncbi:MAG: hypothetical protein QY326_08090 [Bdellovibrionota bacterium]|nr:MAG: hypothetical protein QY326_08090 [Bdellovibrionota bacterium]
MAVITSSKVSIDTAGPSAKADLALPTTLSSQARQIAQEYTSRGGVDVAKGMRALERPLHDLLAKCANHAGSDPVSLHLKETTARSLNAAIRALPAIASGLESAEPHRVVGALQLYQQHQPVLTTAAGLIGQEERGVGAFMRQTIERVASVAARFRPTPRAAV